LRDIFPQWAVDSGILKKGLVWRYFRKREAEQYGVADLIGVESPANLKYFADNFRNGSYRLEVLYNWASTEHRTFPSTGYRQRMGLDGKVVFLYGGNLGVVQDLDNLVRLADRIKAHRHIHILLVGEGSEVSRLEKSIAQMALSNIQILDPVPQENYMSMLAEADVGLISLDRRLKTHNLTGKLLGYLQSGKPVLASVNPGNDLFDILRRHGAGFCILNGDDEGLCSAALSLANNAALRARMSQNSRKLLEELFSVETAVRQIVQHLAPEQKTVVPASLKKTSPHFCAGD
jgi:glycosyltransferase involved in cell wall biosynthesis